MHDPYFYWDLIRFAICYCRSNCSFTFFPLPQTSQPVTFPEGSLAQDGNDPCRPRWLVSWQEDAGWKHGRMIGFFFKPPWAFRQVPSGRLRLHRCFRRCLTRQSSVWSGSAAPWRYSTFWELTTFVWLSLPRLKATLQAWRRKTPSKVHTSLLSLKGSHSHYLDLSLTKAVGFN